MANGTTQCISNTTNSLMSMLDEHFSGYTPEQIVDIAASKKEAGKHGAQLYDKIRKLNSSDAPERVAVRSVSTHKSVQQQLLRAVVDDYLCRKMDEQSVGLSRLAGAR